MEQSKKKSFSKRMDLIVVGGGAAGMTAGILAARAGMRVSILEKNRHFGKKLSITGNGKCNLTNACQMPNFYRSETPNRAWNIVQSFPLSETLAFLESLGLELLERNGYYYPASEKAMDVVKLFLEELNRLQVPCRTNALVQEIFLEKDGFLVQTEGYAYLSNTVLLTTGGLAAPSCGADESGYQLAKQLGHHLIPLHPALTALKTGTHPITRLAGLRKTGKIRIYADNQLLCEETGEVQFTNYGISGIPAMQVSRYAAKAKEKGSVVTAELDFCPEHSKKTLLELLHKRKKIRSEQPLLEWFLGWQPEKLAKLFLENAGFDKRQKTETLTEKDWEHLASTMKKLQVLIEGVRSYDAAQCTAGGVSLTECSEQLESLLMPGLYFAGEILDVDGACGGYNLQWAWSSAACAVCGIQKRKTLSERRTI